MIGSRALSKMCLQANSGSFCSGLLNRPLTLCSQQE
jgi:hypothetical protein